MGKKAQPKRGSDAEPSGAVGAFRDRIKDMRRVRAADLVANPLNWRTHDQRQTAAMRGILQEVGWVDALLVREIADDPGRFEIIDGHLRATQDPNGEVPVLVLDVTEDEARKILLTFDPISAMAGTNAENLDALLRDVEVSDPALQRLLAHVASDAGLYDGGHGPAPVEDAVPDLQATAITNPGDLWILGEHRLLCGDSTSVDDVTRLMADGVADMCWTDPPYNVAYDGGTKDRLPIKNDEMSDENFQAFLDAAMLNVFNVLKPGGGCYVCHADSEGLAFRMAFDRSGLMLKQCLIWVKNSLVLGRQDYHWRHESILYGWKPGASHTWEGGRKQDTILGESAFVTRRQGQSEDEVQVLVGDRVVVITGSELEVRMIVEPEEQSVWMIDRPQRNAEHPTMKPVQLVARAIVNSSRRGESVLDLFGGSGSTMSACEQTGRKSYTMELDPIYCDVIVKRWENMTGKKAVLAERDGITANPI